MSFRSRPESSSAGRSSLLRNRDLAVSTAARAVSVFGDQLAVIVLVLGVHDRGGGAWGVAGVLAAGALPAVLLSVVAGALADRCDSRALLISGSLVQVMACLLLAFSSSVAVVLALVSVLGAVEAVTSATWQALVPRMVGEEHIAAALALERTATTSVSLVAPVAAGALVAAYGTRLPLVLDAATYLAVLVAAIGVRTRRHPSAAGSPTRSRMWDGFVFVRSDPVVRPLLTSLVVFVLLGGAVNVVDVFLVRDTLAASDAWYGAVTAVWLTGMIAGSVLGGSMRTEAAQIRAALGGAATVAVALGAIAAVPSVGWLVPLELVGGIGNGMLNVTAGALLLGRTPEPLRGRVSAAVGGAASAAVLGALALGGVLTTELSPRTIFVIAATAGALCVATTWVPLTRRRDGSPQQPEYPHCPSRHYLQSGPPR